MKVYVIVQHSVSGDYENTFVSSVCSSRKSAFIMLCGFMEQYTKLGYKCDFDGDLLYLYCYNHLFEFSFKVEKHSVIRFYE